MPLHRDAPNVDCRKFILHGVPIALGDFLRDEEETPAEETWTRRFSAAKDPEELLDAAAETRLSG